MVYQEVTNPSWWNRIRNAFTGIVVGLVLAIGTTALLFWNEGRTIRTTQGIGEVRKKCESLPDVTTVHTDFEGKPVYAFGKAETKITLTDPTFGISLDGVLRLRRKVEFYQWVENSHTETRKKFGGGEEQITTYTYEQKWVDTPVHSNSFKEAGHTNTVIATLDNATEQLASPVSLGSYTLPEFLVRNLDDFQTVTLDAVSPEQIQAIGSRLTWNKPLASAPIAIPTVPTATVPAVADTPNTATQTLYPISVAQNTIYLGTPTAVANGDIRIHFEQVASTDVSLIARQVRDTFEPYHTRSNIDFSTIGPGTQSTDQLLHHAENSNQMMAWLLRLAGWVGISLGIIMVLRPLSVLADVVPFIGSIVGTMGTLVAWLLGTAWALLVIAVAWLFYRPLITGVLLIVIIGLFVVLRRATSQKNMTQKNAV